MTQGFPILHRLLMWGGFLDERDKIIKVKSWLPSFWCAGPEFAWPTMIVDRLGYQRGTQTPIWWEWK